MNNINSRIEAATHDYLIQDIAFWPEFFSKLLEATSPRKLIDDPRQAILAYIPWRTCAARPSRRTRERVAGAD